MFRSTSLAEWKVSRSLRRRVISATQLETFPLSKPSIALSDITAIVESACGAMEVALRVAAHWPPIALVAPIAFLGSNSAAYLDVL